MNTKEIIIKFIPKRQREYLFYLKHLYKYQRTHNSLLEDIKNNNKARIAFVMMNLSMWKSQDFLELLLQDTRFEIKIIISPALSYSVEQRRIDAECLENYFETKGITVEKYNPTLPYDIRKEFNPHIIFYQQTYDNIHHSKHDWTSFKDKLLCYIPYSFWPGAEPWGFDLLFHRYAWKIFYANSSVFEYAKSVSLIKARNSIITGYPSADSFMANEYRDVWKKQEHTKKRIIWAPHFTIDPTNCYHAHSSFLEVADDMIELARSKKDTLQFAFKPHPRLKTELYKLWGKDRTDKYYDLWSNMSNTQVETGPYVDLFMTSDALIHDCGSFMVEYHYTKKPCLYVLKNFKEFYDSMNTLGKEALDIHYKATGINEIRGFINGVVLGQQDSLTKQRDRFYRTQLLPPNGEKASVNIYKNIVDSLSLR